MKLFLEVTFVEQTCLFKLYGEGREYEPARIPYSETLTAHYHSWQKAYLAYYRSLSSDMRGRAESGVGKMPERDWRAELVKEEAMLLAEFNRWLKHEKLNKIRDVISRCAIEVQADRKSKQKDKSAFVNLFITCHPGEESSLDLAKLPWEGWEVAREFSGLIDGQTIRIARKPTSIQAGTVKRSRRGRLRVLAIFGDDTQLNFGSEKAALSKVSGAYVRIVDHHSCPAIDLQEYICHEIADPEGWDILFFAGHSNEAKVVNGELSIAPGKALMIHEIAPQLKIAKERGLQFAIFNSCKGLDIANALIELGLSQVAIMREPIHDSVATQFLIAFLKAMTNQEDVHSAVLFACEQFNDSRITYPSAHLIPSLFRHPDAELFRLQNWQHRLVSFLPSRRQVISLAALTLFSAIPLTQEKFTQFRQVVQAGYRDLRQQVSYQESPVILVQIDQKSTAGLDARKIYPMDRSYIAQLVQHAQAFQPKVIGIDYLFDSPTADDANLKQQIQQAIRQNTTIVLARTEEIKEITPSVAPLNAVKLGYANAYPFYVELPSQTCDDNSCPFSLAIAQAYGPLRPGWKLSPITTFSQTFGQNWLQPIIDLSVSPDEAYQAVSAADFLKRSPSPKFPPPIILIVPGNYDRAGLTGVGEDIVNPTPLPILLWRSEPPFTGGESHAYMVHHLLSRRLVIPIPDLWMLVIATVLGRMTVLMVQDSQIPRKQVLAFFVGGTLLWGLIGLELYLSAGLLVPWLIPSIVFWMLTMPLFRRKGYRSRLV